MNRYVKIAFGIVIGAISLLFLWAIAPLVKILVIAALLAYIFEPLVSRLESTGMKRTVATVVVFAGIVLIITGFVLVILPTVTHEVQSIQQGITSGEARQYLDNLEKSLQNRLSFLGIENLDIEARLQTVLATLGDQLFNYLLNAVSLITNLVIIPFIMFFLLKDGREIKKKIISLVPNRYFEFSLNLLYKMDLQLGNYLRGQFLDAVIIGVLSIGALWILGVNYFVIIGAFAGLANLIPYVGPIAGAIPAIIVSIMQTGDLSMVLWIAIAFTLVQLVDNVLVQPLVVAKTVNLHPLIVMLVVIIGGQFFGVLGMLLAVPATGVVKVIVEESVRSFRQYSFE